jgi:hypothetical protein
MPTPKACCFVICQLPRVCVHGPHIVHLQAPLLAAGFVTLVAAVAAALTLPAPPSHAKFSEIHSPDRTPPDGDGIPRAISSAGIDGSLDDAYAEIATVQLLNIDDEKTEPHAPQGQPSNVRVPVPGGRDQLVDGAGAEIVDVPEPGTPVATSEQEMPTIFEKAVLSHEISRAAKGRPEEAFPHGTFAPSSVQSHQSARNVVGSAESCGAQAVEGGERGLQTRDRSDLIKAARADPVIVALMVGAAISQISGTGFWVRCTCRSVEICVSRSLTWEHAHVAGCVVVQCGSERLGASARNRAGNRIERFV